MQLCQLRSLLAKIARILDGQGCGCLQWQQGLLGSSVAKAVDLFYSWGISWLRRSLLVQGPACGYTCSLMHGCPWSSNVAGDWSMDACRATAAPGFRALATPQWWWCMRHRYTPRGHETGVWSAGICGAILALESRALGSLQWHWLWCRDTGAHREAMGLGSVAWARMKWPQSQDLNCKCIQSNCSSGVWGVHRVVRGAGNPGSWQCNSSCFWRGVHSSISPVVVISVGHLSGASCWCSLQSRPLDSAPMNAMGSSSVKAVGSSQLSWGAIEVFSSRGFCGPL